MKRFTYIVQSFLPPKLYKKTDRLAPLICIKLIQCNGFRIGQQVYLERNKEEGGPLDQLKGLMSRSQVDLEHCQRVSRERTQPG